MTDTIPDSTSPPIVSTEPERTPDAPSAPGSPLRTASPVSWVVALALAAMVGTLLFVGGYLAAGARGGGSCEDPSEAF
jgi:hypothetical protein